MPSAPDRHQRGLTPADLTTLVDMVASGSLRLTVTTSTGSNAVLIGSDELAVLEQAAAAHYDRSDQVLLTPREREVLDHVAGGSSTAEVASKLDVSVSTVTAHLTSARRKYGVTSSAAAAARAREVLPRASTEGEGGH